MKYADANDMLMEAVRAYHKARLPHLAHELYAVFPVESTEDLRCAIDRIHTVQALLRISPEPGAPGLYALETVLLHELDMDVHAADSL